MASGSKYKGIGFRIKPTDTISDELDRLARIISQKYKKEINIIIRERGNGK